MVITLIGYRGTGKSTIAAPLAERLGYDWLDSDVVVEQMAGRSIREIFARDGEQAFRQLERSVLKSFLQRDRLVIAAGGGAILDQETRTDMRAAGPVVWLQASVDTILSRIQADASTAQRRPNLTSQGGRREIEQLLTQREPLYRQTAGHIVDTQGRTPSEIVEEILAVLGPRLAEGAAG